MKLTVLGMNGPFPAPGGSCSGYLVRTQQTALQMDLGTGVLSRLLCQLELPQLDALMLTHWHADHCSDVLPLIYALESAVAAGKRGPLHIYAPVQENSPVRMAVLATSAAVLHDVEPGQTLTIGDLQVQTYPARHPVPAMMLRLQAENRTLCYTGDTNTQDILTEYAADADLLLADGLFPISMWAENKPHLSAAHCAQLALRAGAKRLVITHLNPEIDPAVLLDEARAVYPAAELSAPGAAYIL